MKTSWEEIADCLRSEAAEYGQLLHLIDEQQKIIFQRDVEAILRTNDAIKAQTVILDEFRRRRERMAAGFAEASGVAPGATLRTLIPAVPPVGRPLIEALIGEINRLTHRVRRAVRLNQRLLATTLEVHQEILRRLRPDAFTKTYARNGRVSVALPRSTSPMLVES
jgi:flagellar biosynthesis/type III secretory pathway chaperone